MDVLLVDLSTPLYRREMMCRQLLPASLWHLEVCLRTEASQHDLASLTCTGCETGFDAHTFGSAEAHMPALCCTAVFINSKVSCKGSQFRFFQRISQVRCSIPSCLTEDAFGAFLQRDIHGVSVVCRDCTVSTLGLATVVCVWLFLGYAVLMCISLGRLVFDA